jgi:hypothetical protein
VGPACSRAALLTSIVVRTGLGNAGACAERLAEARGWELRTMAERDAVVDRMLALAASRG